jgi:hypothetical protein
MNRLTIFDLPNVAESDALEVVGRTLAASPLLQRIYNDAFVHALVRRRTDKNVLLLRLSQPDDDVAMSFWQDVVADLEAVGTDVAVRAFEKKMRTIENQKIASWRTELWFAAWLSRKGLRLDLEPQVGSRVAEFCAYTTPKTWWEIKSPLDVKKPRADEAVQLEVQKRLHTYPEPFAVWLEEANLELTNVAKAASDIRRQLADFAKTEEVLPRVFESRGLVVKAIERTAGPGYLIGMMGPEYMFQGEHAKLAADHIVDAAAQLPRQGGGVVVIDCSNATWLDEDSIEDACFGEPSLVLSRGSVSENRRGGVFRRDRATRISAVVAFNARIVKRSGSCDIAVFHNPFARVPLPDAMFDFPDVAHGRVEQFERGAVYRRRPTRF